MTQAQTTAVPVRELQVSPLIVDSTADTIDRPLDGPLVPAPVTRFFANVARRLLPWAVPVGLIVLWQIASSQGWLSTRVLPAPLEVVKAVADGHVLGMATVSTTAGRQVMPQVWHAWVWWGLTANAPLSTWRWPLGHQSVIGIGVRVAHTRAASASLAHASFSAACSSFVGQSIASIASKCSA